MEEENLKKQLLEIKGNDYQLPDNTDLGILTGEMLSNIGSIDPILRDELIYTTFYHWLIEYKYYSIDELLEILKIAIDEDHLFYKLGNNGDDSVLTRSFSALLVTLIVARHRLDNQFAEEVIRQVQERSLIYYQEEKDNRGYIEGKGWAHSAAHGADLLDELAGCKEIGATDLQKILQVIKERVFIKDYVFINEEDERMTTALVSLLERKLLSDEVFSDWLAGFAELEKPEEYHHYQYLLGNIKNLLRSLYFRILEQPEYGGITEEINEVLARISNFR